MSLGFWLKARWRLRRPAPIEALRREGDPRRFLEAAFIASARHLALAAAFLSRDTRAEGAVAYLCCRALDGFEDLSTDEASAGRGVSEAAAFLLGEREAPPEPHLAAARDSDRVEVILVERLPLLRDALASLPAAGQTRVHALIRNTAAGMTAAHADRSAYSDAVLGGAVDYTHRLFGQAGLPDRTRRACARLLQLANDLRDLPSERSRLGLLVRAAAEAPLVTPALATLSFPRRSGPRGALTLMLLTTGAFFLRQLGLRPRGLLARPFLAAIAAALSATAFGRVLDALDRAIGESLLGVGHGLTGRADPALRLARTHPDPAAAEALSAAAALANLSTQLFRQLPAARLTHLEHGASAPVLMGDHLLASALEEIDALGPDAVERMGASIARAAVREASGGDGRTEVAAFVSEVVGSARR